MLIRLYTCQNATLLEITCHGSFMQQFLFQMHCRHQISQKQQFESSDLGTYYKQCLQFTCTLGLNEKYVWFLLHTNKI